MWSLHADWDFSHGRLGSETAFLNFSGFVCEVEAKSFSRDLILGLIKQQHHQENLQSLNITPVLPSIFQNGEKQGLETISLDSILKQNTELYTAGSKHKITVDRRLC